MKKKLVQINVVCNGSTGRIMNQIQQKAIEDGWEAYSFYGRGKAANENCLKIGNKLDVLLHVFLTRIFDKHGHGSKRATKKLIKQLEEINPDVIQLHNIHGYYLNIKILFDYLKKCNKKIVWTLHDCWAFTGHCPHFTYPKCDKWKVGCANCIRKKDYPSSLCVDNSKKTYENKKELFSNINNMTIVTPSNWLANLVKESFFKEYDVEVINNGIDLTKFKPNIDEKIIKKYNIPHNKKIFLGVASSWNKSKGFDDFIELARKLDDDKIIILVGLNEKQMKQLPNNIIGINRTENIEELVTIYSIADIFLNLTLEDTFPTVNLEALACGTPVITYDTGGSAECLMENNNVGRKIKVKDIANLVNAIKEQIKNQKECCEHAQKFNGDMLYNKYIEIYKGR